MDTIPFHWDTLDAPQCLRMTCLCPDECHEGWLCRKLLCFTYLLATGSGAYHFRQRQSRHRRRKLHPPEAKGQRCGELTSRLSSHLTFTYLCVVIRANLRFARNGRISFWGNLIITEALWRASVCSGRRYSTLWAYPLTTGICLEGKIQKAYRLARSV